MSAQEAIAFVKSKKSNINLNKNQRKRIEDFAKENAEPSKKS